tara:strand:+ start:13548 stop:15485 length:1938 start_codon:yes stop_codon:yes gene_type:complete
MGSLLRLNISLAAFVLIFNLAFMSSVAHTKEAKTQASAQAAAIEPAAGNTPSYAITLHGQPKYPEGFTHLDYVNPDAPKGGTLKQHVVGTFDSLNPFIVKGVPASGFNYLRSGLYYESLMQNSFDEPFSLYGIVAKDITVAEDKSWVKFNLREEAKWQDGKPITAEDVIWTFKTLTEKGQPFFKAYWHDVETIEAEGDKTVIFKFSVKGNAELPLIIAEMPILPKHYWTQEGHNFSETTMDIPLGSGPYKVGKVIPGRSIEFIRDPNWWGKDLAFFKGMNNFDKIVFDYYRDENVAHEAFLSHDYDVKLENTSKTWHENYQVSKDKAPHLIKEEIKNTRPAGMQAFIYNIRRPLFQDKKVREALAYGFDFEWSNKQFAYGDYTRTNSYFENSELASSGLPSEEELAILEPLRGKISDAVFTQEYKAPVTNGTGQNRKNLAMGIKLLEEAGYTALNQDGIRYKTLEDGTTQTLSFEILYFSSTYEKWVLPFIKNLERMGVRANFRVVDTSQFQQRVNTFDYDMLIGGFGQSESPGNEQREFWGSQRAAMQGSRNYIGIQDPVIDQLIENIIQATSRADLVTKTRAMDRILLSDYYVIPMWHFPKWRIAHWDNIKRPEHLSGTSPMITQTWWSADAPVIQKAEQPAK